MPNPIADLDAYDAGVNADVTTKVAINSVSPVEVGAIGTDLSSILRIYLPLINNQTYQPVDTYDPTTVPDFGSDLDLYGREKMNGFEVWRKETGVWIKKWDFSFGFTFPDGRITGLQTFINSDTVTVTPGSWSISNALYSTTAQTQFTVPAADLNYLRYDLIYADDTGNTGYTSGVASTTPTEPVPAAGQIAVDYVVVPSGASGSAPYLLSGGSGAGGTVSIFVSDTSDGNGEFDLSGYNLPEFPQVTIYDVNGVQSPAQYDNTGKRIIGMNPSEAFSARFN